MAHAEVRQSCGRPTLFVDGQAIAPMAWMGNVGRGTPDQLGRGEYLDELWKAGLRVFFPAAPACEAGWEETVATVERLLRHCPEALIIFRVHDNRMDDDWLAAHQAKRVSGAEPVDGWSLDGWCDAVRAASRGTTRTFVVMHLFAGSRRKGDLEDCLQQAASAAGLSLLMLSVDIADDPRWDLAVPETFVRLRELVSEALVDAVLGGPPCSTWSKLRFRTGGPPPGALSLGA